MNNNIYKEDFIDEDTGEVVEIEIDLDKLHKHHKEQEGLVMDQEYIIHKELKDMLVYWFEDIEELSSKLTSGNVSHQEATIRNKAIRCCSKFIKEYCKTKEE